MTEVVLDAAHGEVAASAGGDRSCFLPQGTKWPLGEVRRSRGGGNALGPLDGRGRVLAVGGGLSAELL